MRNSCFNFKQFSVCDRRSAHKVGTDGVLLGAWFAPYDLSGRVLDIGTGSALIALMAAQRLPVSLIDGIEIDRDSFEDACENVLLSPWKERICLYNMSFQEFASSSRVKYDYILSNPPYFHGKPDSSPRSGARHSFLLPHNLLLLRSSELLHKHGRFSCIIPYESYESFNRTALSSGLFLSRVCYVLPKPDSLPARVLLEYSLLSLPLNSEELVIEDGGRHNYSEKYISLTRDFYLNF